MLTGTYLIALASVAAVLSMIGCFFVARGNRAYLASFKLSYFLLTVLVLISTVYLIYLLINDRFEFSYVSSYSSIELPAKYKITSLWAGQEGSFLLWLAMAVLLGLWVKAKAKEQLGWVMFFFILGQVFLLSLLLISSPFRLNSIIPLNGRGLNPLLQNYWMQIHPPIVFLGFASTFIPFAFAMAALATNKYENWVKLTFPWAILSVCTLGAGLFLGGYWAYETLGWGGYWAWDPVENAILVPWLASVALVHGMILEKKKGTFRKSNLFLAITVFLMTIYGTFLTRSGVLADFSVHSFVDLGYTIYLALFLTAFAIISYGLLIYRAKSIVATESGKSPISREFTIYLGMLFLILSGFLVLIGMSAPLLTRLWGEPAAVDISYYIYTNLPIGIVLGFVLGLMPLLSWKSDGWPELRRKLIIPVTAALIIVIIGASLGIRNVAHILFLYAGGFALVANLIHFVERFKRGVRTLQSDLVHIGVGLMLIGVLISSSYSSQQKISLNRGESKEAYGFDIKFENAVQIASNKTQTNLKIFKGSSAFAANPIFLQSEQGLVRNPFIKKFVFYDLYISPEELRSKSSAMADNSYIFSKGQNHTIDDREFTFDRFDIGGHMGSQTEGMIIGAVLSVKSPHGEIDTIIPRQIFQTTDKIDLVPAKIPGSDKRVYLTKIDADKGIVAIGVTVEDNPGEFQDKENLILDISLRPMINMVWLGLILIVIGSGWAIFRRIREV
ncbi:MAG: cytochrome c biogenesis protein CcsA [candidate division Zixibacteria bacterium]|nr:cytochrome c biogenesis protein CcsA [candidate division Zixibacteria bacterium]